MVNDVKHLFLCSSAIYIFSLNKCLFKSFAHCFKLDGLSLGNSCFLVATKVREGRGEFFLRLPSYT